MGESSNKQFKQLAEEAKLLRKENETLVQIIQDLFNEEIARRSHVWAWDEQSQSIGVKYENRSIGSMAEKG